MTRKAREASLALTTGMAPGLGPVMVTCTGQRAVEDTVAACGTAPPYSPFGLPNLNQSGGPDIHTSTHASSTILLRQSSLSTYELCFRGGTHASGDDDLVVDHVGLGVQAGQEDGAARLALSCHATKKQSRVASVSE